MDRYNGVQGTQFFGKCNESTAEYVAKIASIDDMEAVKELGRDDKRKGEFFVWTKIRQTFLLNIDTRLLGQKALHGACRVGARQAAPVGTLLPPNRCHVSTSSPATRPASPTPSKARVIIQTETKLPVQIDTGTNFKDRYQVSAPPSQSQPAQTDVPLTVENIWPESHWIRSRSRSPESHWISGG